MSTTMIAMLVELGLKYGPPAVVAIAGLFDKAGAGQNVTAADVAAVFANVKPYDSYGINQPVKPTP